MAEAFALTALGILIPAGLAALGAACICGAVAFAGWVRRRG
jgi:hypothetical protein